MFERGLAYRKASNVNWCPNCQTVLANEQVVDGKCERCDTAVTKRKLTQWYLRITDYADRLLEDMAQLEAAWPDKVLSMQRNWIGRSEGAEVEFAIRGRDEPVTVFTTRPDTLYGATFFVVAADSDLAAELAAGTPAEAEFAAYVEQVRATSDIERLATDRPKTGVFLERYAINPSTVNRSRSTPATTSGRLRHRGDHGGASARPARPRFRSGLRPAGAGRGRTGRRTPTATGEATADDGRHVNSGPLDGLDKAEAIARIIAVLDERGTGRGRSQLPPARLADLEAALLGHPDPDRPLRAVR